MTTAIWIGIFVALVIFVAIRYVNRKNKVIISQILNYNESILAKQKEINDNNEKLIDHNDNLLKNIEVATKDNDLLLFIIKENIGFNIECAIVTEDILVSNMELCKYKIDREELEKQVEALDIVKAQRGALEERFLKTFKINYYDYKKSIIYIPETDFLHSKN